MSKERFSHGPEEGKNSEVRHSLLMRVYEEVATGRRKVWDLFDADRTVHADLDLNWIDADFLKASVGNPEEFQVVIATVRPNQTSKATYQPIGASAFPVT